MDLKAWKSFLRPSLWVYILAIYLLGFLVSGAGFSPVFLAGAAAFILINTASITVNHYFDRVADKLSSQARFPVADGRIQPATAARFSVAVMLASILISLTFPLHAILLTLFALFMVVAYSAPPLRVKERPFFETLWNGLGYGTVPYYLALLIFQAPLSLEVHMLGLIPFLVSASGHILLQVRDIEADVRGNVTTTSTKLGFRKMVLASRGMIGLAGLLIAYLAASGFLNWLAWVSIISGAFIFLEHRKMKVRAEGSYPFLRLLYLAGGVSFLLSAL